MEQARSVLGLRGCVQPPQLQDLWPSLGDRSEHFVLTYKVGEEDVEAFRFAADADIYGDGSCLHPHEDALSAAGFACAQRAADGRIWSISGPLPRWMPQTSAWAERTASMMARLHLATDSPYVGRYRGDNVGALTLFRDPAGKDAASTVQWGGLARAIVQQHPRGRDALRADWVKAHVEIGSLGGALDKVEEHTMNNHVDRLAGIAAAEAGPPSAAVLAYSAALDAHVKWVRAGVHMLALWPVLQKLQRVATAEAGDERLRGRIAPAGVHKWSWGRIDAAGNGWGFRCLGCLRTCSKLECKARSHCGEVPAVVKSASHAALMHAIVIAKVGGSTEVVAC
jgi:hypothetical protein